MCCHVSHAGINRLQMEHASMWYKQVIGCRTLEWHDIWDNDSPCGMPSLKTERCHDANFVVTGGTVGSTHNLHGYLVGTGAKIRLSPAIASGVTSLTLVQSPVMSNFDSEAARDNIGKCIIWIHYELIMSHQQNKSKQHGILSAFRLSNARWLTPGDQQPHSYLIKPIMHITCFTAAYGKGIANSEPLSDIMEILYQRNIWCKSGP